MTLGEGKQLVVALLDEYSNNGTILGSEHRGRMDHMLRFSLFFDLAQKQAALARPLVGETYLCQDTPGTEPGWREYPLPAGFLRLRRLTDEQGRNWELFRLTGEGISLPESFQGVLRLEYDRVPATITLNTPDTTPFEVAEDAQAALPYSVAAQCLLQEEPETSAFLQEQFQNLLLNLRPERTSRQQRVENRLFGGEKRRRMP